MIGKLSTSLVGTVGAYALYQVLKMIYDELTSPYRNLPGPKSTHWLFGNILDIIKDARPFWHFRLAALLTSPFAAKQRSRGTLGTGIRENDEIPWILCELSRWGVVYRNAIQVWVHRGSPLYIQRTPKRSSTFYLTPTFTRSPMLRGLGSGALLDPGFWLSREKSINTRLVNSSLEHARLTVSSAENYGGAVSVCIRKLLTTPPRILHLERPKFAN
jgi:hypothetical protein